jgi:hypothetical protein
MKRFAFLSIGLAASFYAVHARATEPTLGQNAILSFGQSLVSPGCAFHLDMQGDGNLVLYRGFGTGAPLWATGTHSNDSAQAIMQGDGNLVIYDGSGRVLWASWTNGWAGAYGTLQDDGNFVIYNSGNGALWSTRTNGEVIGQNPCELKSAITQTWPDTKYLGTFGSGQGNVTPLQCAAYLQFNAPYGKCVAVQYEPPGADAVNPSISWCMCMESVYWAVNAPGYEAIRVNN